jgi:hypothetical protein
VEPREILARLAEFGTPPDPASALRLSVGLDQTIDRFRDETLPFVADGGAELQFAFAPYGRGKTHLLRTLQEVARQQGFATSYVDCRSGEAPFASLQETYRIIASNLVPAGSTALLSRRSGPEAIIEEAMISVAPERARERVASLIRDDHVATDYRNLASAYCRAILQDQHGGTLGSDLRALLRADQSARVRVNDLYRGHSWLPRPIGKLGRRNAASWLRSLGSLPMSLGYPGLVILFDETEQTHSLQRLNSQQRRLHLANLRNFVDHMALGDFRGCAIYYAVVEEFLETAKIELEALSQRIERIHLGNEKGIRNPRAVWVDLDELTDPSPESDAFYDLLGARIVSIGLEAGLPNHAGGHLTKRLREQSERFSASINLGAVREFVKLSASLVAQEVSRHG